VRADQQLGILVQVHLLGVHRHVDERPGIALIDALDQADPGPSNLDVGVGREGVARCDLRLDIDVGGEEADVGEGEEE